MKHKTLHFLYISTSFIFSLLPRGLKLLIGRNIGLCLYVLSIRKKVAKINLKIAFANKSEFEIEKILFNCYRHFGMVFIDFLTQQSLDKNNLSSSIIINKKHVTNVIIHKILTILSNILDFCSFIYIFN